MSRPDPFDALGLSLSSGAAELYLVRHADAVPDGDGALALYDDYEAHPLSSRGKAQAELLAEHLVTARIAAVYSSPVPRAVQTALPLAARGELPLHHDEDLREIRIGALAGGGSVREQLEALATIALREGSWTSIPGTEASHEVRERMMRALDTIAARHRGTRVAVVSHAGAINATLAEIAGTSHDFVFPLGNASISTVRINGVRRMLLTANETAHLRR